MIACAQLLKFWYILKRFVSYIPSTSLHITPSLIMVSCCITFHCNMFCGSKPSQRDTAGWVILNYSGLFVLIDD
jgi:hypothetical protein